MKKITSKILVIMLIVTLLPMNVKNERVNAANYGIVNPLINNGVTTWDAIYFGNYYQSNDKTKEPIKWRVLQVKGNDALIISDKAIDVMHYNKSNSDGISWKNSTIRSWLNGYDANENADGIDYKNDNFITRAFNTSEKSAIIKSEVIDHIGLLMNGNALLDYYTDNAKYTKDSVFLLAMDEVTKKEYGFVNTFENSDTRQAKPTNFAASGGTAKSTYRLDTNDNCYWWLRDCAGYYSAAVEPEGALGTEFFLMYWDIGTHPIRPALHINLDSGVWKYAGKVKSKEETNDDLVYHDEFTSAGKTFSGERGYYYSDSYFNDQATTYNQSLATMSLCLAFSTYGDGDKSTYDKNVKKIFQTCGFASNYDGSKTYYQQYHFNETPSPNSVGCAIGSKKLSDGTRLIAIAIRSGGYEAEWASNLSLGQSKNHEGFDLSAETVKDFLLSYIIEHKIEGKIKIWITGYSRGAAIATQTAAKLDDLGSLAYPEGNQYKYINFNKESIYAYGFATPAGAITTSNPHSSRYNNIFNIIEYNDPVPLVAPANWKFDRYGMTKILPYAESSNSYACSRYIQTIKNMMGKEYRINNLSNPISVDYNDESIGELARKLVNGIADSIGSRSNYYNKYQNSVVSALYSAYEVEGFADKKVRNILDVIEKVLPKFAITHPYILTKAIQNCNILADVHANQKYYVYWMQLMDSNYKDSMPLIWGEENYRVAKINCPVDVYVYDNENTLLTKIENEKIESSDNSLIITGIDENGQKIVYLPVSENYNISIIPREKCIVSFAVEEFIAENGDSSRVVCYKDVCANIGDEMIAEISAFSDIELEEGASNGSVALYTLSKNETLIEKEADISGKEEIDKQTYTVSVDVDEMQGSVQGGGKFVYGSYVKLTATNKKGYEFNGFYVDGKKIIGENQTENNIVRFKVEKNIEVEARFTKKTVSVKNVDKDKTNSVYNTPNGAIKIKNEWISSKLKNTKILKVVSKKKTLKITLKRMKTIKGYQIQVATDRKFKKSKKTVFTKSNKKIKVTVKKLKAKRKYYIRVRTYREVKFKGKIVKVYSKWSRPKIKKTK